MSVFDCQKSMESIIAANPELKHATLSRIKSLMHDSLGRRFASDLRDGDVNRHRVSRFVVRTRREDVAYSFDDIKDSYFLGNSPLQGIAVSSTIFVPAGILKTRKM